MKMNVKGNDCFETPQYIFDQLNNIFNFEIDVACNSDNKLCPKGFYHDLGFDSLIEKWQGRCFCNSPFSQKAEFIRKADEEIKNGNCPICVMILPSNCMDTKIWHEIIERKYHYEVLQGRISFIDPETKEAKKGNNSGTVIVFFKNTIKIK